MTWNPLYLIDYEYPPSLANLENGNRTVNMNNSNFGIGGTMSFFSGKWYWEVCAVTVNTLQLGVITRSSFTYQKTQPHANAGSYLVLPNNGSKYIGTSSSTVTGLSASNGDIYQIAFDRDNMKLWFGKNGTYLNSGNPATGTNPLYASTDFTIAGGEEIIPVGGMYNPGTTKFTLNAGQDSSFVGAKSTGTANASDDNGYGDFYYAPPSGFLAPCSANEPTSTDIDPGETDDDRATKNFGVVLFDGNGSTNAVTGLGFKPDFIWGFTRSHGQSKRMIDSSRGGSSRLYSDSTAAATGTNATNVTISEFGTDGFTANGGFFNNDSGKTCGAWCWKANGGTTSTNTSGTVTSTVQANTVAGFSIVQYAGTLSSTGVATVGHGLNAAPDFYMIKNPDKVGRWFVWHTGMSGANYMLELNSSAAEADKSGNGNMSLPTSSVFSTNYTEGSNENTYNNVTYCWHSVNGYSRFSSYVGNGDNEGPYAFCGFKPRLIFIKNITGTSGWTVIDSAVYPFNNYHGPERAEWQSGTAAVAGGTADRECDILANGFRIRTNNGNVNTNGSTYVWGAWAEIPFKFNNTHP